jgi:hypothetical protein
LCCLRQPPCSRTDPLLRKQRRTAIGELHIAPARVQPQPVEGDGAFDPGAEVVAGTANSQEGRVHALDKDAAVLHGLDVVRDLRP